MTLRITLIGFLLLFGALASAEASNGHVCCIVGVCCPPPPDSGEALASVEDPRLEKLAEYIQRSLGRTWFGVTTPSAKAYELAAQLLKDFDFVPRGAGSAIVRSYAPQFAHTCPATP